MSRVALSEDQVRTMALKAAREAVAAGEYPSEPRLRKLGARGDNRRIQAAMDDLIRTGALVLPPEMYQAWVANARKRQAKLGSVSGPAAKVKVPRVADPSPSPVADDIREGKARERANERWRIWKKEVSA